MAKPLSGPKIDQLMKIMGYEFVGPSEARRVPGARLVSPLQSSEPSPNTMSPMIGDAAASWFEPRVFLMAEDIER